MQRSKTMHIESGRVVEFLFPTSEETAQYVKDWFNATEPVKPPLRVTLNCENLKDSKSIVYAALKTGKLSSAAIVEYAYWLYKKKADVLSVDWESFGIVFGKSGNPVGPLSLVKEEISRSTAPAVETTSDGVGVPDFEVLLMCLAPYRFQKCHENLRGSLMTRLKALTPRISDNIRYTVTTSSDRFAMLANANFKTLVALTDMYFNMFPNSEGAFVRFATIGSRFKDCAAASSIHHAINFLGLNDDTELLDWVYTTPCKKELENMMKAGQELDHPYSYFPYQADFGLVQKSYYSTVLNPTAFFFLHMICGLLGSERSLHARMPNEFIAGDACKNAMIAAYAMRARLNLKKGFIKNEDDKKSTEDSAEPNSTSGSIWYTYMHNRRFQLTKNMNAFIRSRIDAITCPRSGSIGAYIKNMI